VRWGEFAAAAPELAELGERRFRSRELCLVGTLRRNGWPRISPVEPEFVGDELMLGMMWQSPKARDLARDPRIVVHSTLNDRHDLSGDFKLYGQAVSVDDDPRRAAYSSAVRARIDWEPVGPYHVFAVEIESAGFVTFAVPRFGLAWETGGEVRRWEQRES
jgi:hypothetical protein